MFMENFTMKGIKLANPLTLINLGTFKSEVTNVLSDVTQC